MDTRKKLSLLEEMLELDEGTLRPDMPLTDVEEWDSVSALSLIVLLDETFEKEITGQQIKAFKTVGDILEVME